jgi:hypothetical protein
MASCLKRCQNVMCSTESEPETDQQTLEEIAGLYLFKPNERVKYLDWKTASKNMSLTKKERGLKRDSAVRKLRNVIKKRMPNTEKLVLEAKIQAEADRKHQEKIQLVEKALSIATPKERESYDNYLVGATDPKKTRVQQQSCADNAMEKLRLIIARHAEEEKRAAMTPEELEDYDNDPERVAAKAEKARNHQEANAKHTKKEAALCIAGDPDALARRAAHNEAQRKWQAATNQAEEEKRAAMTTEELAMYDNEPERVAAKAEKARNHQAAQTKNREKEATLRHAGDTDALSRQAAENEAQRKRYAAVNQAEEEKRAAMTPKELAMYDNDPERVTAKAEKTRRQQEATFKHLEKEAALCLAGDPDALARQAAKKEIDSKRNAATYQRKKEEEAKNAKIFPKSVLNSTVLGEGDDERQETLTRTVEEIMGGHAGSALDPSGIPTSEKWVMDHGDVSVGVKLAEGEYAAYLGITRTTVHPGNEQDCKETTLFLTQVKRDPLWRMLQKDGDLTRMSPKQAKSVVNVYLLAKYENPYDVTSVEGACQFYLENELGLPHGICLHKRAGAGNRLKDSMTADEYKLFRSGKIKGWSLNLTMIRTTDRVFAEFDPFDPERSPPLVSASILTNDGTGTVYSIRVRGNKQRFPDTPSVVADGKKIKDKKEKDKARRQKRKRNAAESVDSAESPEEMEEETAKKRKIEVVEGGE